MDKEAGSLILAAAVGAMVVGTYQVATPGIANVRVSETNDPDLAKSERGAAWMSAAIVAGVSLIAREPLVFILGSGMIMGLSWWHRHANNVNPQMEAMKRRNGAAHTDTVPLPAAPDLGSEPTDNVVREEYEGVF